MKKITDKIYNIALHFLQYITLLLSGLLFLGGFLWTCYAEDMTSQEVLTKWDNPIGNLLGTAILGAVFLSIAYVVTKATTQLTGTQRTSTQQTSTQLTSTQQSSTQLTTTQLTGTQRTTTQLTGTQLTSTQQSSTQKATCHKKILLIFTLGWMIVLGVILILFSKTVPAADAMSVYSAAESLARGDTSVIHPTESYLTYYPQQVGLMAFFEVLIRLWNLLGIGMPAYHYIKGIYILLLCTAVFFQYKSVHCLWENDTTDCLYLILAGANFPLIMYSSFVYGEIPSLAAFSVGLYYLLHFVKAIKNKSINTQYKNNYFQNENVPFESTNINTKTEDTKVKRNLTKHTILSGIASLLFLTLSVMLRKNSLILIIAVVLVLLAEWLKSRKHTLLIFALVCAVFSGSILPLVQKGYELRAGTTLKSGVTPMSYFAMGTQESSRGNGWYNGFNLETYQIAGMDTERTNEISRQALMERLDYFKENPGYAADFYLHKHLSQWADGTYASRQATLATFGGRTALFQRLYEGDLSYYYIGYCNLYQNLLYLGAFLFCILQCFSKHLEKRFSKQPLPQDSVQPLPQDFGQPLPQDFGQPLPQDFGQPLQQDSEQPLQQDSHTQKGTVPPLAGLPLYIGFIGVIGGFLFHIIWEANSRYIFIYGVLLLPYAAFGLTKLLDLIIHLTSKNSQKIV